MHFERESKYIFCVVSDHYPALAFQAKQFLKYQTTKEIQPPFVMDVFALDAMTEMLDSPLQFLSYVNRRTNYTDRLLASDELTLLSYHLKNNLWLDDQHDFVVMSDDISVDLDVAMAVRRDDVSGASTPDGILTKFLTTALGRLVKEIEARPDPGTIDLGFMLLTLNEETVRDVSNGIDWISKQTRQDKKTHDLTIGVSDTGLTIHCTNDPVVVAGPRLERHCSRRKYTEKANSWFGVCVHPEDSSLRFGVNLKYEWKYDAELDALTKNLPKAGRKADLKSLGKHKTKVGRNELCPCGSGKKYKKCCLNKS